MEYQPSVERYDRMQYKNCGNSGLLLPRISLGLWHNFGSVDDFGIASDMIKYALLRVCAFLSTVLQIKAYQGSSVKIRMPGNGQASQMLPVTFFLAVSYQALFPWACVFHQQKNYSLQWRSCGQKIKSHYIQWNPVCWICPIQFFCIAKQVHRILLLEYLSLAFYFQRYKKLTYDEISSGSITANFIPKLITIYANLSYSISSPNVKISTYLTSALNRSITINGQFTCCPIENGRPNTGNQRTENFSITISARYSSNSITHYLSGSPSEIQMLTEPHITSVSPSSGISDGYNFVINTDCISINKIMAGIYSSL